MIGAQTLLVLVLINWPNNKQMSPALRLLCENNEYREDGEEYFRRRSRSIRGETDNGVTWQSATLLQSVTVHMGITLLHIRFQKGLRYPIIWS